MKLILIRHGESETNNLTEKGKKQIKETREKLVSEKIDVIFCSPTNRCQETMEEILKNREDNVMISFSKLIEPKRKAETIGELKDRISLFIDDLKYEFGEDQTVVVISHKMPIRMFACILTAKDLAAENGSVNIFEVESKSLEN